MVGSFPERCCHQFEKFQNRCALVRKLCSLTCYLAHHTLPATTTHFTYRQYIYSGNMTKIFVPVITRIMHYVATDVTTLGGGG